MTKKKKEWVPLFKNIFFFFACLTLINHKVSEGKAISERNYTLLVAAIHAETDWFPECCIVRINTKMDCIGFIGHVLNDWRNHCALYIAHSQNAAVLWMSRITVVKIWMYGFMPLQCVSGFSAALHATGDAAAAVKKDGSNFQWAPRTFGHFYMS